MKGIGLRGLLDAIVRYLPSPADEAPVQAADKSSNTVEVQADENGPLLVRVFKTTADPFVGRLTYLPASAVRHPPLPGPHLERQPGEQTNGSVSSCSSTARNRNPSAS